MEKSIGLYGWGDSRFERISKVIQSNIDGKL
jgi:hypothetical protein